MDYEKERAKLYNILYGRELEPEYEDDEETIEFNESNCTASSLAVAQDAFFMVLPLILLLATLAFIVTAPARFMDWFERGGVPIKKFEYPDSV